MTSNERVARVIEKWKALKDLSISADFTRRLANANGWTEEYAEAVDREYRRFLLICLVSDKMTVPSIDVDRAWHEHILHTRSYQEMCSILGYTLHHDPAPLDAKGNTHIEGYRRTISLYTQIFRQEPPMDIWPRSKPIRGFLDRIKERFKSSDHLPVIDDGASGIISPALFETANPHPSSSANAVYTDSGKISASNADHPSSGGDASCGNNASCGGGGCGGD